MIWNDAEDVIYNGYSVDSVWCNGVKIWPNTPTGDYTILLLQGETITGTYPHLPASSLTAAEFNFEILDADDRVSFSTHGFKPASAFSGTRAITAYGTSPFKIHVTGSSIEKYCARVTPYELEPFVTNLSSVSEVGIPGTYYSAVIPIDRDSVTWPQGINTAYASSIVYANARRIDISQIRKTVSFDSKAVPSSCELSTSRSRLYWYAVSSNSGLIGNNIIPESALSITGLSAGMFESQYGTIKTSYPVSGSTFNLFKGYIPSSTWVSARWHGVLKDEFTTSNVSSFSAFVETFGDSAESNGKLINGFNFNNNSAVSMAGRLPFKSRTTTGSGVSTFSDWNGMYIGVSGLGSSTVRDPSYYYQPFTFHASAYVD